MTFKAQTKVPATYMRGGTSKGVFFRLKDLPEACQTPGEARGAVRSAGGREECLRGKGRRRELGAILSGSD